MASNRITRRPSIAGTPDWVANRASNSYTPLGRLSRHLWIAIMQHIDDAVDLYMLRQTCYIFASAFSDYAFAAYHHPRQWYCTDQNPSRLIEFHISKHTLSPEQMEHMLKLLCREGLLAHCQDCRRNIKSGKTQATLARLCTETQYCGYCRRPHPLLLFSHSQRRQIEQGLSKSPSSTIKSTPATCILNEGRIHVCPHKSFSYENACAWKAWLMNIKPQRVEPKKFSWWVCKQCYGVPKLWGSREQADAHFLVSFLTRAAGTATGALSRIWGTVAALLAPNGTVPPGVYVHLPNELSQPNPYFVIQWTLPILRIKGCRHGDGMERITNRDVQAALTMAQKRYPRLLCGHVSFTDGAFLRAFCIDGCSCESVANHDKRAIAVSCHLHSHTRKLNRLITDEYGSCYCEESPPLKLSYLGRSASLSLRRLNTSMREFKLNGISAHGVSCGNCSIHYGWVRTGHQIFIKMTRNLKKYILEQEDACSMAHFTQYLDPHSYGLDEDEETRHITWCQDRRCKNGRNYSNHLRQIFSAHSKEPCQSKCSLSSSIIPRPMHVASSVSVYGQLRSSPILTFNIAPHEFVPQILYTTQVDPSSSR